MDFKITRSFDNAGRIVIPADFRKLYDIFQNDKLVITATEKGIYISKEKN